MTTGGWQIVQCLLAILTCALIGVALAEQSSQISPIAMVVTSGLLGAVTAYLQARSAFARRLHDVERLQRIVHDLLSNVSCVTSTTWIAALLEQVALHAGAHRAWLVLDGADAPLHVWSVDGRFAPADAEAAMSTATIRFPWRQNQILIAPGQRSEIALDMIRWPRGPAPVHMILLRSDEQEAALIGLVGHPTLRIWPETANAVASSLAATVQTLRRLLLEHTQLEMERKLVLGRRMETIGAFASGMAHNLNNIIAAISGFGAIAELHVEQGSTVAGNLADIQVGVTRARALVRDVLNFGRRLEGPASSLDIPTLLSETSVLLAAALPANVSLHVIDVGTPVRIKGNFGQLQQVLLNLCDNAALAMPDGGTIDCRCAAVTVSEPLQLSHATIAPGSYITIAIRDEGPGIPPAIVQRMFEPFFTTRGTGTGLGLSTASDIVAEHKGAIDVSSAPGHGSCFALWLPLDPAIEPEPARPEWRGRGEIVLIFNADTDRLAMDEEILAALGYEPCGVSDPSLFDDFEGLIDAVIIAGTDHRIVMSTFDALHEARWRIPLLIATSSTDPYDLYYPFRPGDLAKALVKAFAAQREQSASARSHGANIPIAQLSTDQGSGHR